MQTILVINSKGGCGKSTISTNLAAYYAAAGAKTTVMDYDVQGSATQWLRNRPEYLPHIHGIHASRPKTGLTKTWQMVVPTGTEKVVIDAPAGITGHAARYIMQEMFDRADVVIVPAVPSPMDLHATASFLHELGRMMQRRMTLHSCVVANRVRRNAAVGDLLKTMLAETDVTCVTSLMDSDCYITATERGMGIYDMEKEDTLAEREQWTPLFKWLASPHCGANQQELRPRLNVVSMSR